MVEASRARSGCRLLSVPSLDARLRAAQFSMQERRDKRREGEKEERDLQKQLREIEAAAAMSMSNTLAGNAGKCVVAGGASAMQAMVAQSQHAAAPGRRDGEKLAPPPPPPRRDWGAALERRKRERGEACEEEDKGDDEAPKRAGVYEVKGVTYFEGEHHADKLQVDMACQLWLQSAEEWVDGVVTGLLEGFAFFTPCSSFGSERGRTLKVDEVIYWTAKEHEPVVSLERARPYRYGVALRRPDDDQIAFWSYEAVPQLADERRVGCIGREGVAQREDRLGYTQGAQPLRIVVVRWVVPEHVREQLAGVGRLVGALEAPV